MNFAGCGVELRPSLPSARLSGRSSRGTAAPSDNLCDPDFAFCAKCGASVDGARGTAGVGSRPAAHLPIGLVPSPGVVEHLFSDMEECDAFRGR
jgi:hypothetical protein